MRSADGVTPGGSGLAPDGDSRLALGGGRPLDLGDPQAVYMVSAGEIAVFTARARSGSPDGPRRHLLTASAGHMVPGLGPELSEPAGAALPAVGDYASDGADRAFFALPLGEAAVERVSYADLARRFPAGSPDFGRIVRCWVLALGEIFRGAMPAIPPRNVGGGDRLVLAPGDAIVASDGQLAWVRLLSGSLQWMGHPELAVSPDGTLFPVAGALWLQAEESAEVEILSSAQDGPTGEWAALQGLHASYRRYLGKLDALERDRTFERFAARQDAGDRVATAALAELSGVLETRVPAIRSAEGTPLLAACRVVGESLGVPIHPPRRSDKTDRPADAVFAVARASGCRVRQVVFEPGWWKDDCGALVGFAGQERRPVALLPGHGGVYTLVDPVRGGRERLTPETAADLDPEAFLFYRPLPATPLKALDLLKFALRGRLREIVTYLLLGQAATLLAMIIPLATGMLIDQAIPESNRSLLFQMGFALAAAAVGGMIFSLCDSLIQLKVESSADASTQAAVWDRVLGLPAPFYRKFAVGDLALRVSMVGSIRKKLAGSTLSTVFSSLFAFQYLILMIMLSPRLALLGAGLALVSFVLTLYCSLLKYRVPVSMLVDAMVIQLIHGVSKIRVAGAEQRAFAHWSKQFTLRQKQGLILSQVEDSLKVINDVFTSLATLALFGFAFYSGSVAAGQASALSTGTFLAFNAAYGAFIAGFTRLSDVIIELIDVNRLWRMCKPVLDAVPEVPAGAADPGRLSGRVRIERVSFRYRPDGPAVLQDVSLHAEAGEEIAIVGPSGCGKSTLVRLLLGFEAPQGGKIYFDGEDFAKLDPQAVRRQFGTVLQDGKVLAGSILENVAGGAIITREDAWEALRLAGLEADVRDMPMGLETLISEGGTSLSGGQRQRLLLARAFGLRPRILIFDEATSALDNETQALVTRNLEQINVTRIVIAHRMSTIARADRIYVLDQGKVVQRGTFEELAAADGLFARLIARQLV